MLNEDYQLKEGDVKTSKVFLTGYKRGMIDCLDMLNESSANIRDKIEKESKQDIESHNCLFWHLF